jgi:hypothetical protein
MKRLNEYVLASLLVALVVSTIVVDRARLKETQAAEQFFVTAGRDIATAKASIEKRLVDTTASAQELPQLDPNYWRLDNPPAWACWVVKRDADGSVVAWTGTFRAAMGVAGKGTTIIGIVQPTGRLERDAGAATERH